MYKKNTKFFYRALSCLKLNILLKLKLTFALIFLVSLQVSANTYGQRISLNVKNIGFEELLDNISAQTGVHFLYKKNLMDKSHAVSVNINNISIKKALDKCFVDQPFIYIIDNQDVILVNKTENGKDGPKWDTQQKDEVTGTVTDDNGSLLSGVSVVIKGTNKGTITDSNGKFNISVNLDDVLEFRFVGFTTVDVSIKNFSALKIRMTADSKSLSDVIVVAYGTQKKSSLTAAIGTVSGKELSSAPVSDIRNALGGRVAGILMTQSGGEPGFDGSGIQIRGVNTTGNSAPLVIVDGVPRSISQIDPNTVESVSVLKDAAAVAPYGLGGANGVLLITTKKGKSGKPTLTYNSYFGWQNPTVTTKFTNAYQYATLYNAADDNMGAPHAYSEADLELYKNHNDPNGHPDNNVLKELLTRNNPMSSNNLQLSGGTENIKYFSSLGFLSQDGLFGSVENYKRYNLSANIEAQATKTTKIAVSLSGIVENGNYPGVSSYNIFYQAFRTSPNQAILYTNGQPGSYIGRTAWGNIYESGHISNLGYTMLNQISLEQQLPFVKGLSVKADVSYDYNPYSDPNAQSGNVISFQRQWLTPIPYYGYNATTKSVTQTGTDGPALPQYSENFSQVQAFDYQGFINYHNSFGKNEITGLVVLESRNTQQSVFSASRINYNVPIPELNNGSSNSTDISNSGYSLQSKQKSAVYRISYAYDGKYLFEGSGRYDGSYYYAPGHRFGFFPAFAAGWRISEEPFIKNNFNWINNLKIRGSWGESANLANNGPFQYLSSFNLYGNSAVIGGAGTQGLSESSQANSNITWEKAKKTDVGIEGDLWNGFLTFNADYFFEKRDGMLVSPNVTTPAEYGIGLSQVNAGSMNNRGLEISLGTTHHFNQDLIVGIQGNLTYARNKLLQIFETAATYDNPNRRVTGRPLGTLFGYQSLGYFKTSDFDASGKLNPGIATQLWGTVHPGDIEYKDVNGDGKIDDNDIVPIGSSYNPRLVYGLTTNVVYKSFDLSVFLQGAADRNFYDAVFPFDQSGSAILDALNYWTPTNQNAVYPRITTQPTTNNTQTSSFWVKNGRYLRVKTVNLGYTIPQTLIRHLHLQSVRFYVSGQNLFTWSPIKNFDPEVSASNGWYYPSQKVTTVGLNATF